MKAAFTLLLTLACVALPACDAQRPQSATTTSPRPPSNAGTPPATEAPMPMQTIDSSILEQVKDDGGSVAVVRVLSSSIENPGTRSEAARLEAEVLKVVHGTLAAKITMRSYTKGGNPVLTPGGVYVVALFADPRFAPALDLLGHAASSESRIDESAKAHQAILEASPR